MQKRPLCVLCSCFILLTVLLTVAGISVPWQERLPRELSQTVRDGAAGRLYGQLYRIESKAAGCTLYIKNSILVIRSDRYSLNNSKISYSELPDVRIGDSLCAAGDVFLPDEATNPGQFDAAFYHRVRHISVQMRAASVSVTKRAVSWLPQLARQLRERMGAVMERSLPPEESGILKTMLLGDKEGLEEDVRQLYQKNGISHILAISGVHISLLGMGLYRLLRKRLPVSGASVLSGGFLFFYLLLTGFPVSAQRAVFMFWIRRGAEWSGRTYDEPTAISLAAMVILCENPLYICDSGFQLSFGAAMFLWLLKKVGVGKLLFSLDFWLCMLPLTAYYYYEISLTGIALNMLVLPSVGAVLFLGIAGSVAGMLLPWLGTVLLLPAGGILKLYTWLGRLTIRLPFASLLVGRPPLWSLLLYAVSLSALLIWQKAKGKKTKKTVSLAVCIGAGILLVASLVYRLPGPVTVTMLDVGQGDCLVIQKGSSAVLVDGGSTTVKHVGKYRIVPYLKYMGIRRISGIVLSHPDQDHMNGLQELLEMRESGEYFPDIGKLTVPSWMEENADWSALRDLFLRQNISVVYAEKGDVFRFGGAQMRILHPEGETAGENSNAGSLTFMLETGGFSMLFTGDLEGEGEKSVLKEEISCDVLKVAHHGSASATTAAFLQKAAPGLGLISCGANNRYGHPAPQTLKRLEESGALVLCTTESGAVRILPGENGFSVRTFRKTTG